MNYREAVQHYSRSFKVLKEWKGTRGFCCPEARLGWKVGGGSQIAFFIIRSEHVSDSDGNKRPRLVKRHLLSHHSVPIAA